jgi:hypothetical protein
MSSKSIRILDGRTMGPSEKQPAAEVADLGAYRSLECQFRVAKAGSGGNAQLQHAPVNTEDAFQNLGSAVALNAAGPTYLSVAAFLRFVRWVTDGAVSGSPVLTCDIIAKD